MTVWVLGDQLHSEVGPLAEISPGEERVLLVEAHGFARRMPYHPQKLTLLFSAMRHFRDELRAAGHEVEYRQAETFGEALADHFAAHPDDHLRVMNPASHGAADRLREIVAEAVGESDHATGESNHATGEADPAAGDSAHLEVVPNDLFLCTPEEFDDRFDDVPRHETFYRWMRERTGYLMDGDDPEGGEWNYDEDNRQFPPDDYEFPDPPSFPMDETTREVADWVREDFETWGREGDTDRFQWPVTREQALDALDHFVTERLPEFGPYQDAMLTDSWAGNHALLSPAINLGLLRPEEAIERAISAYEAGEAPIESVEGFVRQLLGWREFVRHVYRREMPEMAESNHLDATRDLPPLYYDGETDMNCLDTVVGRVHERGYSHHIERLMILSNFALVYGADPHELNRWFHFAYVDAYHWVTTPNVVGMGSFATDALSTKPYAASANYVDRMSDFCEQCRYDPDQTTGENACPFNSLYWDFLAENEDTLRGNHRMGFMYHNLDKKSDLDAIRARAEEVRKVAEDGEL